MKQTLLFLALGALAATGLRAQAQSRPCPGIGPVRADEYAAASMHDNAIPDNAFKGASLLKAIVLPDNITSIGAGAFSGCDRLESVMLYSLDITSVGEGAFPDRDGLTITVQTDGVKAALEGSGAFRHTKVVVLHPTTGLASVGAGKLALSASQGGMLRVDNWGADDCGVSVCDMSGRAVAGGTAVAMGAYTVRLTPGWYIVTVGGKPYKIIINQ